MKYWTKEVKVALIAIVAFVCIFIGINFLKGVNVFESSNSYYVTFKDVNGLAVNNPVYANGYPVGIVQEINYNYGDNGGVVVRVELDHEMHVPQGTKAEIVSSLMGGVSMTLILGPNPTANLQPRDTIVGALHLGALDKAGEMIPQMETMLPKLDSILSNINALTANPALMTVLNNAAELSSNLRNTSEALDKLMANDVPSLINNFNGTADNLNKVSGELAAMDLTSTKASLDGSLQNVQELSATMKSLADKLDEAAKTDGSTLGALMNDRELYNNINHTVQSADSLLSDIKAHPKRYVNITVFGGKK